MEVVALYWPLDPRASRSWVDRERVVNFGWPFTWNQNWNRTWRDKILIRVSLQKTVSSKNIRGSINLAN